MPRPVALEEFDKMQINVARNILSETESFHEQVRLESYEQGYQAGWDDASVAQQNDQQHITLELENALKDLSFTFYEARAHVLKGVEPLLRELVETILPAHARAGLPNMVSERLQAMFSELSECPIILSVSPRARQAVEAALPSDPGFPITLREESTLGDGQVFLNLGATEEMMDLDSAITSVQIAIDEFFHTNRRTQAHG